MTSIPRSGTVRPCCLLDQLAAGVTIALSLCGPDLIRVQGCVMATRRAWFDELVARARRNLVHGSTRAIDLESSRASLADICRAAACKVLPHRSSSPHALTT